MAANGKPSGGLMSIYLNAGGHGLPSADTRARVLAHAEAELASDTQTAAETARAEAEALHAGAARLLGADPAQLALGQTTTQFWLIAMARLPLAGRRLLLSAHEWGRHLRYLHHVAPSLGLRLDIVPEAEALDPAAWAARIDDDLAAIAMQHVTSAQGITYPVAAIGALPRPDHTLLVVDAAQSLGRVPASLGGLNCDLLMGTARKWIRAPRANAIMALSHRAQRVLGCNAAELQPMDANTGTRLGMGVALHEIERMGVAQHGAAIDAVAADFRAALAGHAQLAEWLEQGRPAGQPAPGHITLRIPAPQVEAVTARLERAGILAKWARPSVEEPLSAAAADRDHALLRITPHLYNTAAEAEALAAALGQ